MRKQQWDVDRLLMTIYKGHTWCKVYDESSFVPF